MDIIIRRLLLGISIILFLIIAPIVVLYALGYRENIISGPTAVGVLFLDAIPEGSNVIVNNRSYGATPESISNLKVGNVDITVSKEGYHAWQKTLPILPARATEARSIRLFLENPPMQTLAKNAAKFALAPNRTLLAWTDGSHNLHVHSTENEMLFDPIKLTAAPLDLLWSSDSNYILISYANDRYQVLDMAGPNPKPLTLAGAAGLTEPTWDMRTPGRLLFFDPATNSLVRYSLRQNQQQNITGNITTYAISSRQIYILNQQYELLRMSLDGEVRDRQSVLLPDNEVITRLLVTPDDQIAALSNTGALYLLDDSGSLQKISANVLHAAWSPDASMLLIQPQNNELFVYNVSSERAFHIPVEQMQLVTRLSRPIKHPQWFAGGNHFIYQVDDSIVITEIDTRDHPISHTVDTTNLGDASVTVGQEGQIVYYLKKYGPETHLIATTLTRDN